MQSALIGLWLMRSHKRPFTILKDVSGAIKPVRCLPSHPAAQSLLPPLMRLMHAHGYILLLELCHRLSRSVHMTLHSLCKDSIPLMYERRGH